MRKSCEIVTQPSVPEEWQNSSTLITERFYGSRALEFGENEVKENLKLPNNIIILDKFRMDRLIFIVGLLYCALLLPRLDCDVRGGKRVV